MDGVTLDRVQHKGWDAWRIRNGALELILVPQVGGRIMGLYWQGHLVSFTQPEREGQTIDVAKVKDIEAKKKEMGFPLWGGDKSWLAPQERWVGGVPFFDLDSGPYELTVEEEGPDSIVIRMTSHVCRETGMRLERVVQTNIGNPEEWTVTHRMTNDSSSTARWGLWDVNMILRPGRVYLPTSRSSPHADGVKTFEEEGESVGARASVVGELEDLAVVECRQPRAYKYGVDSREGWMLAVLEVERRGLVGYSKRVPAKPDWRYAHGTTAEVYNSDRYPYLEMEIHGPLVRLKPGESFAIEEWQRVFDVPRWPERESEARSYVESRGGA